MNREEALLGFAIVAASAALLPTVARRLPVPLPVLLLLAGVIAGPDVLGVFHVSEFEEFARVGVSLAVAVIVFEGSLAIRVSTLRSLGPVVRNLVVGGLIITPIVGTLAAHYLLGFGWRVSGLFGALVCVTGPSVITPLLRSIRVNDRLKSILSAEGVIIDPFGALLTLFLLQIVLADSLDPTQPAMWVATRLVVGVLAGLAGAVAVYGLSRLVRRLSAREISVMVLGSAIATFAAVEASVEEAGLTAIVVMGITLGNLRMPHMGAAIDFQESVVTFLVATVYVLLAASVDLDSVRALGWAGLGVVLALVLVGRPLLVVLSSWGSNLSWREQLFLSAVAPRGVVAASLASVVAVEASRFRDAESGKLVAMVFVVIATTITVQSAYAGSLARVLRVYPMSYVVAGAGEIGRRVAARLSGTGLPVVLVEPDEEAAVAAREEGFEVLIGNIADANVQKQAGVGEAEGLILATADDATNLLAAQHAKTLGCKAVYTRVSVPENMEAFLALGVQVVNPAEAAASELAGLVTPLPLDGVVASLGEDVTAARIKVQNASAQRAIEHIPELSGTLVVLVRRGQQGSIPHGKTQLQLGDELTLIGPMESVQKARSALSITPMEVLASGK